MGEHARLLVGHDGPDGDLGADCTGGRGPETSCRVAQVGEEVDRETLVFDERRVPTGGPEEIEVAGRPGARVVGDMEGATAEAADQVTVHRAPGQVAALGAAPPVGDGVDDSLQLGRRRHGHDRVAVRFQLGRTADPAQVAPHHDRGDRLYVGALPDDDAGALGGDPDGCQVVRSQPCSVKRPGDGRAHALPERGGVLLHQSRKRVGVGQRYLCCARHLPGRVEHQGPGTGGADVQAQQELRHRVSGCRGS